MLVRLTVDGFKNLAGFDAEFGPFNCIAAENGVGKSNIFDAIEFLSLIANGPLIDAARQIRSTREDHAGEPLHLFPAADAAHGPMHFRAEMIVPAAVEDDFGVVAYPSITFVVYEVDIAYEAPSQSLRQGRLVVDRESLTHINRGDAVEHLGFPHKRTFRDSVIRGRRSGGPFISTLAGEHRIIVHQDGGSRGRPKRALPTGATTTVVSTVNSAEDPTVLAVRREMQSWRRLALEPTSLRAADRFSDSQRMSPDGQHLAAALNRIANASADCTPEDVFARITSRLGGLNGVDVRSLRVDADETRQLLTVFTGDRNGRELPARSLSEGTLRYLALAVLLEDPTETGLICMEEPENGIHPANLAEMVDLVRDLAIDPTAPTGLDNPLRQVIVNTHSPAVVQLVGEESLLLATAAPSKRGTPGLRLDGLIGTWRARRHGHDGALRTSLLAYLTAPPGAQIQLFDAEVA